MTSSLTSQYALVEEKLPSQKPHQVGLPPAWPHATPEPKAPEPEVMTPKPAKASKPAVKEVKEEIQESKILSRQSVETGSNPAVVAPPAAASKAQ
jgi:hypothetical protein